MGTSVPPTEDRPEQTRLLVTRIGLFIYRYGQVLAGMTTGLCSIIAALIIADEVKEAFETNEKIMVVVEGFNDTKHQRFALMHNYGNGSGTLMPKVVIVMKDKDDTELMSIETHLNSGYSGGSSMSPFTLTSGEGKRYFMNHVKVPEHKRLASCTLKFQVMQPDGRPRQGESSPFDCKI